jgi:hypothetical protein
MLNTRYEDTLRERRILTVEERDAIVAALQIARELPGMASGAWPELAAAFARLDELEETL